MENISEISNHGHILVLFVTIIEVIVFILLLPIIMVLYVLKIATNLLRTLLNRSKSIEMKQMKKMMKNPKDYEDWYTYASKLDEMEDREKWKEQNESDLYDYKLIQERVKELKLALETNDAKTIMKCVQIGLKRNIGGICNPDLHRYCYIGTKKLIEEYYDLVCTCLDFILEASEGQINNEKKFKKFKQMRQSFGGTAIMLSGGASLGQVHLGVIKALIDCDILPNFISGSSVGSIMASIICTNTDEEINNLIKKLEEGKLELDIFENDSISSKFYRLMTKGYFMDVNKLRTFIHQLIPPDLTFKSAYEKTGRILNISISNEYEGTLVLNYITAPSVYVWSAVLCSCSAPFLYDRVKLKMKGINQIENLFKSISKTKWSDGSLNADLPQERMRELFNINHFIVSQVNPYITPFLQQNSLMSEVSFLSTLFEKAKYFFRTEITHRINQLAEVKFIGSTFKKLQRIVNQNYIGDINIYPSFSLKNYLKVISSPTKESLKEFSDLGMVSTFSKISQILTATKIERKLDQCIEESFKKTQNDVKSMDKYQFKLFGHSPSFHSKRKNESLPQLRKQDSKTNIF